MKKDQKVIIFIVLVTILLFSGSCFRREENVIHSEPANANLIHNNGYGLKYGDYIYYAAKGEGDDSTCENIYRKKLTSAVSEKLYSGAASEIIHSLCIFNNKIYFLVGNEQRQINLTGGSPKHSALEEKSEPWRVTGSDSVSLYLSSGEGLYKAKANGKAKAFTYNGASEGQAMHLIGTDKESVYLVVGQVLSRLTESGDLQALTDVPKDAASLFYANDTLFYTIKTAFGSEIHKRSLTTKEDVKLAEVASAKLVYNVSDDLLYYTGDNSATIYCISILTATQVGQPSNLNKGVISEINIAGSLLVVSGVDGRSQRWSEIVDMTVKTK
jgi:hypothetical protein